MFRFSSAIVLISAVLAFVNYLIIPPTALPTAGMPWKTALRLSDSGKAVLVDARPLSSFDAPDKVPSAKSLPYTSSPDEILSFVDQNRGKTLAVFCASSRCDSASTLARSLSGSGHLSVFVVEGGFLAYKKLRK